MTELVLLLPLVLLAIGAFVDLKTREIPDSISISLVGIAICSAIKGWAGIRWELLVVGAVIGLAIGYLMFRFANFGGGDAKLIAALGALLGPVGLVFLLFWMGLFGGILALVAMARGKQDYAYGPAIAAAYAAYLIWPTGFVQRLVA